MPVDGEPRFLGRTLDYARCPTVDAVECVSADEQARLTAHARLVWRVQQRRAWGTARAAILDAISALKASGRLDRRLAADVHVIERLIARVDREIDRP